MKYSGSCHCGQVQFEAEGALEKVMECNCSHCSRKGYLLWFVPEAQFTLKSGQDSLGVYTFNKHAIRHQFCRRCGCAPFAAGQDPSGAKIAAVNVRCLDGVDLATLQRIPVDGRSF